MGRWHTIKYTVMRGDFSTKLDKANDYVPKAQFLEHTVNKMNEYRQYPDLPEENNSCRLQQTPNFIERKKTPIFYNI